MKIFLLKQYYSIILLTAKTPTLWDKFCYLGKLIAAFGPVIALMDTFKMWFNSNSNFIAGVLVALVLNMGIGIWYHLKMDTFSWKAFFAGNSKMFTGVFLVYVLLELLRFSVGSGVIGEGFKIIVQTTTMLWPISKSLKNLYIINEKKFPPGFIMDRLYSFEKTGDIKDLIDNSKTE